MKRALLAVLLGLGLAAVAMAQNFCAVVKLEIAQQATLEREAFDAHLNVSNNLATQPMTSFKVQIFFKDSNGNPADSNFFVKIGTLTGTNAVDGTGVIQSSSTADVHWLIIPSSGTGGINPAGQRYAVSALISGISNGAPQSVTTFDAFITVHPQPLIKLEYALPYEVFADEPLTLPIEPIEPFPLAVRVTNVGFGTAKNFQIDSAQPKIVENKQGLQIDFKLLGTVVGGQTIPNTLLIPFGDVAPSGVAQASWIMSTSLSGRFIDFTSTFTHAADLGGQLTSLMQSVTTYTLLKDMLVDLPGRDKIPDFLVNQSMDRGSMQALLDAGGTPPAEMILESDQPMPLPVVDIPATLAGALGGTSASLTFGYGANVSTNVWVRASVPFPYNGRTVLVAGARRADGKVLNASNVWLSKHFRKSDLSTLYRLNIVDLTSSATSYVVQFSSAGLFSAPGAVTDLAAVTDAAGGAMDLSWTAPGESGYVGRLLGGRYLLQASEDPNAAFDPGSAQVNFTTSTAPGNRESYSTGNLIGNTIYFVRLWTQNSGGDFSGLSNATTSYTLPNAPNTLSFSVVGSTYAATSWLPGNNRLPVTYQVLASTMTGGVAVSSSPVFDSFTHAFLFGGLSPNATAYFTGLAFSTTTGNSVAAALGSAVTLAVAPSSAPFFAISSSALVAQWGLNGDPSDTEFLAELSTSPDHSPALSSSGWVRASSAPFAGLLQQTAYYGRVKARNRAAVETAYAELGSTRTIPGVADALPPRTTLAIGPPTFGRAPMYVSGLTTFTLTAVDDSLVIGDGTGVGVAHSYVQIDSATVAAYGGPFTVSVEGLHTVSDYSVDLAGNAEVAKSTQVAVDLTPPVTSLLVSGSTATDAQGNLVIGPSSVIELAAADPISSGVASGLDVTFYGIDTDLNTCQNVPYDPAQPLGSCANQVYQGPFQLSVGTHTVYYLSSDNVANEEIENFTLVTVSTSAFPYSMTPSTGPIGIPFTLAGSGFGSYQGGNSRVRFGPGGPLAPISVWNDAAIQGTIPALSTGAFAVAIEQQTGSSTTVIAAGNFIVLAPKISTVTPASAPIGTPFTLSGGHFGPYAGTLTRVLIGGATTAISVWNDSTIQGTVPGAAPSGVQALFVERATADGGLIDSSSAAFTVSLAAATSINPSTGPIGIPFTIAGSAFGPYNGGNTRVRFGAGGPLAPISVWNDATISGTIPGLSTGAYALLIERQDSGVVSSVVAGTFTALQPMISTSSPTSGPIGTAFSLSGSAFGPYAGSATTALIGGATAQVSVWNDTNVQGTVPGALTPGVYPLVIQRTTPDGGLVKSSSSSFQVIGVNAGTITPSTGPIGVPFTLAGTGFGVYGGGNTRVRIGGVLVAISVWNDTTIQGTIPGLSTGSFAVCVERQQGANVSVSTLTTFGVVLPVVSTFAQVAAPIGAPFTLAGASFGPYAGAMTRVLIGGATTAISVWNDVTISGTVPGAAPAGSQPLIVERATGDGGLADSATVYFTVASPATSALNPSTGPIGIPFTLAGSGFGPYAGANTRVRFGPGGPLAPVSVWNDAAIAGTVPGLSTGAYSVLIERQDSGVVSSVSAGTFTVRAPLVASMSPTGGPIATVVTLSGSGFGPYGGSNTRLKIAGIAAPVSVWNDATVTGTIPGAVTAGTQTVTVEFATADGGLMQVVVGSFVVSGPMVGLVDPSTGSIGIPFTITGSHFGVYAGANTRVRFGVGGPTAPISVWNDATIQGTIPTLSTGAYALIVERSDGSNVSSSSPSTFTVVLPLASTMTPVAGSIGAAFTLSGTAFGPYGGALTRVLIGNATAPISVWNDSTISGTLPGLAGSGPLPVVVVRGNSDGGTAVSPALTFTIASPSLASVSPSSAPMGAPFTLTGTAFGAYAGGNTRVKIGGLAAPISVWNDSTISGTIPGGVASGTTTLVVQIATADGGLASVTTCYLVVTPLISQIVPATGQPGDAFEVDGAGFGPYGGSQTQLMFGGVAAALSVWNDTMIRGVVPDSLSVGTYTVFAVRSPAGGSVQSNGMSYTVGSPIGPGALRLVQVAHPAWYYQASLALPSAEGGKVTAPSRAAATVPARALDKDTSVTIDRAAVIGTASDSREGARLTAALGKAGEPVEFGPSGTHFTAPVIIELPYDPTAVGLGDQGKIAVHYYDPASRTWTALLSELDPIHHTVRARTDHFSLYQPLVPGIFTAANTDSNFTLHQVYAFPNPARGAGGATIRVQPGQADWVEVRVYDVSGALVRSGRVSGGSVLDDGNGTGPQWTFDYAFDTGSVASGVYVYAVTAHKDGSRDLHKTNRLAVIK